MKKKRAAVRTLVETVLLSGSILPLSSAQRMLEGAAGHRALQAIESDGAQNEVTVSGTVASEHILLTVYGRIDRLYGVSRLEEIKTTYAAPEQLHGGNVQHWAQAKCYAHLFCAEYGLGQIEVSLTYFHLGTGELTTFTELLTSEALAAFFEQLSNRYLAMLEADYAHATELAEHIASLDFPYEAFRTGQRELASQVYYAIANKQALLAQAPTGTGKTMAVLFPALKALGGGHAEKIFYLTARTTQQEAAVSAVRRMNVPVLRTVVISAKEKMCVHEHPLCREGTCSRAEGYYDRLGGALDDACRSGGLFTRAKISELAATHFLCPFELSLDLSSVCDVIIGDYNYAFDPRVRLQRFFTQRKRPFVLLIDEAHNLPDRARAMFSATLSLQDVIAVRRSVPRKERKSSLYKRLTALSAAIADAFAQLDSPCALPNAPDALLPAVASVLEALSSEAPPADIALARQLSFSLSTFSYMFNQYDEQYRALYEGGKTTRRITLFCADASHQLAEVYKKCSAKILFSATLTPHEFYRNLCGLDTHAAMLALPSPFPPERLAVFHLPIDTRYQSREQTREAVADAIAAFLRGQTSGNYLIFLPSHAYLASISGLLTERLQEAALICQQPTMDDAARAEFLACFAAHPNGITAGLCVMGGVFAEGIDLPGERLSGAVIVGVGLPQLCLERDVLKAAYESRYAEGYRYAYQYPGVSKVLQSAGRVIRTETDRGALLLIDHRYGNSEYRALLPAAWNVQRMNSLQQLSDQLAAFWSFDG